MTSSRLEATPFICHIARDIRSTGGGEVVKQVACRMADHGARVVVITDTPNVDLGKSVKIRRTPFGAHLLRWKPASRPGWIMRHSLQIAAFTLFSSLIAIPYRLKGAVIFNHNCESLVGQVLVMHNVFSAELRRRDLTPWGTIKAMINPVRFMRVAKERSLSAEIFGRRLVAVSPAAYEEVAALGSGSRTATIANGVDLETFDLDSTSATPAILTDWLRKRPQSIPIVFIGHEYVRKGLDDLLGAMATLPEEFCLLVVGGASQDGSKYSAMTKKLNISDRVLFAGEHEDVRPFLRASAVFCLPSHYETMPLVALEALASGVPVVLTQECPASDLIQPGISGVITGHDAREISDSILSVASFGSTQNGREIIRATVLNHGWDAAAAGYLDLARSVASTHRTTTNVSGRRAGIGR